MSYYKVLKVIISQVVIMIILMLYRLYCLIYILVDFLCRLYGTEFIELRAVLDVVSLQE